VAEARIEILRFAQDDKGWDDDKGWADKPQTSGTQYFLRKQHAITTKLRSR
jgi:hypothetical protein